MRPGVRFLGDERGFTLAELLITTAVVGLVMAGVFVVQRGGQQAYLFGSNRVETQQNARVALDLVTRELRTAEAITALASATDITFKWRDEGGTVHTIRYALSGTTLSRTFDGSTRTLIGGVQSLSMSYYSAYDVYNGTYTTTTDPLLVKVIKISLQTRTEETVGSGSAGDARAVMESTVTLRSTLG